MTIAAKRLGLTLLESDLLWLLVCVELEPQLTQAAQLLVSSGMHSISVQILEDMCAATEPNDAIIRLSRLGLVEVASESHLPTS